MTTSDLEVSAHASNFDFLICYSNFDPEHSLSCIEWQLSTHLAWPWCLKTPRMCIQTGSVLVLPDATLAVAAEAVKETLAEDIEVIMTAEGDGEIAVVRELNAEIVTRAHLGLPNGGIVVRNGMVTITADDE